MEEPVDGEEEIGEDIVRMLDAMRTSRKWPPLFHRVSGENILDLVGGGSHLDIPAHRKLILLVLLLVVRDRASAIRFEPWRFEEGELDMSAGLGFRMIYEVDGKDYDLVPPPHWLKAWIAREIQAVADLNRLRRRVADLLRRLANRIDGQELTPRRGGFRLKLDDVQIDVEVLAYASDLGERYFLRLAPVSELASDNATKEIERLLKSREVRLPPDLPEP